MFDEIKPGDSVRRISMHYRVPERLEVVKRVTKTMIILDNDERYRRKTGSFIWGKDKDGYSIMSHRFIRPVSEGE